MHKLRELRMERGMTQFDLGVSAQIHPNTISSIEHGRIIVWPKLAHRIGRALGLDPAEVFPEIAAPLEASALVGSGSRREWRQRVRSEALRNGLEDPGGLTDAD